MADKIFFKTGLASSLPTTKTAGQLLFAIDGTTGSIYLDKDSNTRIKFNADAVKLATPRSINGTSFDGSADITTANWGTARNISISDATGTNTGTAVSVNGSKAVTLKLPATIVATLKGNADTATKATTADSATTATSCTGNAATATKLKTGVAINGTTFDGSAAITTANWGTARTITISDNTGDYTQANTGINGSANFTLKLPATITATLIGNASSATYATNAGTADTAKACTGNAATASKLKTGVAINGTTFDGSAAITTTKWGTARNVSIGNSDGTGAGTAVSVDGSGAVTLKLPTEIKANVTSAGKLSGDASDVGDINTPVYFEDGIPKPITSIDVKSDKAGKLDPGASINGTLFTGESNITTSSWGTARTVTISDNSGTNTQANTGINGSANFTLKLPATIKANLTGKATSAGTADSATTATTATTCTGNAGTATKLKTAVAINGTNFDGSTAITTANWGTARDITIVSSDGTGAGTAVSVNGSGNVSLKLPATIKANLTGKATSAGTADSATTATTATTCTGNAATASKLKTSVAINGTTFDGSTAITTTKWGTSRTLSISSTAGTTGTSVDGSENKSLIIPATLTGFTSITSTTFVGNLSGKATSAGTADSATIAASCTGNAATATKLKTARTIALAGDVTGSASFDGGSNISITTAVANDSHNHTYSTISLAGSYQSNTDYTTLPNGVTYVEMPATATSTGDPTYGAMLTVRHSNIRAFQIVGNSSNKLYFRGMHSSLSSDAGTGYGPWRTVALSDGGTYTMNITGNASGTAGKLATARNITISGTASSSVGTFDGGSNTTIYMPLTIQGFNEIKTKKLTITSTEQVSHLAFSRGGWNYFTAPVSGCFAFVPNGGTTTNGAGATFVITATTVQPGEKNNTIDLGTSSYKWKGVYATTFYGALSGNATTATTLATSRAFRISDTANSTSTASFNGSADATLYIPTTIKGFTSIESDKYVVNDKVTLQYNTTNECLEFVFA